MIKFQIYRVFLSDHPHPQEEYLDCLWHQIKRLRSDMWIEKHIIRPYLAFDSVLCEALQHNISGLVPPPHHSQKVSSGPNSHLKTSTAHKKRIQVVSRAGTLILTGILISLSVLTLLTIHVPARNTTETCVMDLADVGLTGLIAFSNLATVLCCSGESNVRTETGQFSTSSHSQAGPCCHLEPDLRAVGTAPFVKTSAILSCEAM